MLTREELGAALAAAIAAKEVTQQAVADAFGVTQPSVAEWIKLGRIGKQHIPTLLDYFKDVAGPAHWGLPFTDDEFAMILAFREMHPATQQKFLSTARAIAAKALKDREDVDKLIGADAVPLLEQSLPKRRSR